MKPVIVTMRRRMDLAARTVTALAASATGLALLARTGWIADLATHFAWQYAAAALVAAGVLLALRRPAWTAMAVAVLAVNLYVAWPEEPGAITPPSSHPFRVVVANVFFGNSEHERVIAFVRSARPDAVVFVEVTPEWRRALAALENDLPHAKAVGSGRHGVLLMSRVAFTATNALSVDPRAETMLHARLPAGARNVDLFAVHANWPLGRRTSEFRNRQLEALADHAAREGGPVVIAGDLNVTPYSPRFRDLIDRGRLRSAAGRQWAPTWPTWFPPAAIQIDHVLVSSDVGVRGFETGPRVGSDHLPIVADLVF